MQKFYETLKSIRAREKADYVIQLSEKENIPLEESMNAVNEYLKGKELAEEFRNLTKDIPAVEDYNEYGISMIDSDKDW